MKLKKLKHFDVIKLQVNSFITNNVIKAKVLLPLILVMIAIFFKEPIEGLINLSLVDPFLSKIDRQIIRDIFLIVVFLVSLVILGIKLFFNNRGKIDLVSLYHIILLLGVYLYYRFDTDSPYNYEPFTFSTKIKYFDVLICCLIVTLLKIEPLQTKLEESKSMFFEDHSGTFKASDLFHRDNLIKGIAENSMNLSTKKSFAIAIQGEWGSGKSYVLSQIRDQIKAVGKENIIIEFDPWKYDDSDKILNAFFNEITKEIKNFNKDLSNQISKYSKAILSLNENTFTKAVNEVVNFIYPSHSISDLYTEIANALPNIGKRFHIFIDDLDRLDSDEVLEILKLIRNTANFPNTIFYVAFDKDYISDVITKSNKIKNEEYLEKIFQLQVSLPKINPDILFIQLKELLKEKRDEADYKIIIEAIEQLDDLIIENQDPENGGIFPPGKNIIKSQFKNLRDIIRFLNMVNLELPLVYSNIDIQDFMLLMLIKYKRNDVFQSLKNQNCFDINSFVGGEEYRINYTKLEKQLEIINGNNIVDGDLKLILEYMYNANRTTFVTKSIRFARNQMLYFAYDSFGKISHNQFLEIIDLANPQQRRILRTKIAELNESDLLGILLNYNPTFNRGEFEKVIELYRTAYNIVGDRNKELIQSKIEQYLTKEDPQTMNLYDSEAHFANYIRSFLNNAELPYYIEAFVAHNLLKPILYGKIDSPLLDQESLKTFLRNFLKSHLENEPLSDAAFNLFYLNWEKIDLSTNIFSLTKDALELMKQRIELDVESRLFYTKYLIRPYGSLSFDNVERYVLEPFVRDIFHESNEFENFLSNLPEDIEILGIRAFYRRIKHNNYKPTPYNRNLIEIESDSKTEFTESKTYPNLAKCRAVEFVNPNERIKGIVEKQEPLYKTYKWIAHALPHELTNEEATKGGEYVFTRSFEIPKEYNFEDAEIFIAFDDDCEVILNDYVVIQPHASFNKDIFFQKADKLASYLKQGMNTLKFRVINYSASQLGHQNNKKLTHKDNIYGFAYSLRIQLKKIE